eukprot:SAG22_NODE_21453_length_257_cov_0.632911_1_plen_50_part_10
MIERVVHQGVLKLVETSPTAEMNTEALTAFHLPKVDLEIGVVLEILWLLV